MTIKYTSVKSVLYNVSLLIDDRYWNEAKILEWVVRGLRQVGITQQYIERSAIIDVINHKAELPNDLQKISMVSHVPEGINNSGDIEALDLPESSGLGSSLSNIPSPGLWKPMHYNGLSTNLVCVDPRYKIKDCCTHSYSVSPSLVLTTTFPTGPILIQYLSYPVDEEGFPLMPNDETLKEALQHYVLYNYWMSKYTMKEEGAEQRLQFHLNMWQTLSMKSKNLNLPDEGMLERLRVERNTLNPKSNHFSELFLNLGRT
jgi:hypothetical protein